MAITLLIPMQELEKGQTGTFPNTTFVICEVGNFREIQWPAADNRINEAKSGNIRIHVYLKEHRAPSIRYSLSPPTKVNNLSYGKQRMHIQIVIMPIVI